MRTGQSGHEYIKELLDLAHPERVHHILRIQLATFYALRDWLHTNTDLKGDNIIHIQRARGYRRQVSIEEKLAIFIYHPAGLQIEMPVKGSHEVVGLLVGMYYLYLNSFFYLLLL